jgi:hypothetical protein
MVRSPIKQISELAVTSQRESTTSRNCKRAIAAGQVEASKSVSSAAKEQNPRVLAHCTLTTLKFRACR